MSVLTLDFIQRLNLHALIGAQRATVDDMRLFWTVQDRIALTDEEKDIIGWHIKQGENGQSQVEWTPEAELALMQVEPSQEELNKLNGMIKQWKPGFMIGPDRSWMEPLLKQLDNGSGPK